MHIWLVTNLEMSPSTQLVIETCAEWGWTCDHIIPSTQSYNLTATRIEDLFIERRVQVPDFCFIRMGSAAPAEGFAIVSKIESLGIRCFNQSKALIRQRDKAQAICDLTALGVPTPATMVIGKGYALESIVVALAGPPWVLKTRFSTKGLGVMLVESERSLSSALDTLLASHTQVLVQEFVSERSGTDIRVIVVCGKALVAMQRTTSKKNEFRSNLFLGGQGKSVTLTQEISDIAESAAKAVGLDIVGVDLLGEPGKYTVAEVNTSPGIGGISKALGRNVAEEVLHLFELSKES